MEPPTYIVRNMIAEDISQIMDIYKEVGWNTGNHSIYTWHAVDPDGFKVAVTDTGKVLAVCCAIRNDENLYFIGYYIVDKSYRGKGIGTKVWNACMKHVGSKNAGLNAAPGKMEMYRSKGVFSLLEEEWLVQAIATKNVIDIDKLSDFIPKDVTIVPFSESYLLSMFEYDFKICGYDRKLTLELNCKEKETNTLVALKNGFCVGFGTIKRSVQEIPYVGPLYADDPIVAEAMLKKLLLDFPLKKGFSIVTLSSNEAINNMMKKMGCPTAKYLSRLYKTKPDINFLTQNVFALFDIDCSPV